MELYDFFVFILKASFVVIIFLSILIGVILPLYHGIKHQPQQRTIESPVRYHRRPTNFFIQDEEEVEIPTAHKSQADQNRDIIKMALEDTNKTALLVRKWIQEKKA